MAGYIGSKASVVSSGAERKKTFDITTSTTSLTGLSYTVGQVHVFHNGVRLVDGTDYTATNGTSITLTAAAESGDQVVVVSYATFQTSDTVSASAGGTFAGAVDVNADGATVLTVDRATSDGTIIDVQKNGTSVGSIGTNSNGNFQLYGAAASHVGLQFGSPSILPINSTGASSDNAVDLGDSNVRFKDLYLSGGVYLGGTGSANKLDDYEVGTWTPVLVGASGTPSHTVVSSTGYYVRIGNLVHATMDWYATNVSGGSGDYYFTGLPFTRDMNQPSPTGPARLYQVGGYNPAVSIYGGSAIGVFVSSGSTNSTWRWGVVGDITGTSVVAASISYKTT
jgi:hypothetical protein